MTNAFSRRSFLQGTAFAAAGLLLGSSFLPSAHAAKKPDTYSVTSANTWHVNDQTAMEAVTQTVNYRVGTNTITVSLETRTLYTGGERLSTGQQDTVTDTYTLSQPLQGIQRRTDDKAGPKNQSVVWTVPAGTVITRTRHGSTGKSTGSLAFDTRDTMTPLAVDTWDSTDMHWYAANAASFDYSTYNVNGFAGGESLTVEGGMLYQIQRVAEEDYEPDIGGFVFQGA